MHAPRREPFVAHARYEPGEILGQGAQGVVGRVIDREARGRELVAKVFRQGAFREDTLLGEFALLARLRVPGVVRAHDLGRDERTGAPFLVEEYVAGDDAAAWVQEGPAAERPARLARVLGGVARTLAALHDAGFVHSDLKPAHVRMRPLGGDGAEVVLLDLGAAVSRARAPGGAVAFTSAFAAPELLAGGAPSPASDLYSLGALAWCSAAGRPPGPFRARRPLRHAAPWVQPSVAEVIEALLALHPRDRPAEAREVLLQLGVAAAEAGIAVGAPPAPIGRERELEALQEALSGRVRYITGPSGAGKSHLGRELVTRALLGGRSARYVAFPREADPLLPRLIAFFRGAERAPPFVTPPGDGPPLLLLLDDLEQAPAELRAALDAYRCRPAAPGGAAIEVVATVRSAPEGAACVALGPLDDSSFGALCRALGVDDAASLREAAVASGKNPGWLFASLGRVPLTKDTAIERARGLSAAACAMLAAIAIAGGSLPEALCRPGFGRGVRVELEQGDGEAGRNNLVNLPVSTSACDLSRATLTTTGRGGREALRGSRAAERVGGQPAAAGERALGELLAGSLIARREDAVGARYTLSAPALARDLAAALATPEIAEEVAAALLADPGAPASALLSAAAAPCAPARRAQLHERAAAQAREAGLRSEEIEALLALGEDADRRTPGLLCRLERLTRDAGVGAAHPQVVAWLDEAARRDERVLVLALRRRAEKSARDGDATAAKEQALAALAAARRLGGGAAEAFALSTLGLVALMRADWGEAEAWLAEAQAKLPSAGESAGDVEEVARLHHNAGVVALYRGQVDDAARTFEASLAVKRSLGDRAGMRSCLMNLGIALGKASRYDEAFRALDEATRLARSLGQVAGRGWCLSARADIEVRRGDARAAERCIEEAWALAASLPAAIQADLVIARANVALLDGDGRRALAALSALAALDPGVRASDPLVDARAQVAEAQAYLARLPAEPRRAARGAIRAARRARAAMLAEVEAQALDVLRSARQGARRAPAAAGGAYAGRGMTAVANGEDDALWAWIASVAAAGDGATAGADGAAMAAADGAAEAATGLARALVRQSGAERALLAVIDEQGRVVAAWGADMDGLEIAEAARRIPPDLVQLALSQAAPVHYQRDVETPGGRGSRLLLRGGADHASMGARLPTASVGAHAPTASMGAHAPAASAAAPAPALPGPPRALVVVEHRFRAACFDAVTEAQAARWASLAGLFLRLFARPGAPDEPRREGLAPARLAPPAEPAPDLRRAETTVVPVAPLRRSFPDILGQSPALRRALARLDAAIDSDLPVLLTGETGTGKELFARALHELGPRRSRELVAVNCGAVPDTLFEAELFGHARASFTGAERARPGLLARAEGGTLFLDELGELPLARQAALLRALESRRYRPVGGDDERPFDVRIVAATNLDLARAVAERAFRQDLLFRVNAIEIHVPPLRDREGDVRLLLDAYLGRSGAPIEIAPAALAALEAYAWPGNVRELAHLVQRLSALGVRRVELAHLPRAMRASARRTPAAAERPAASVGSSPPVPVPPPAAGRRSSGGARRARAEDAEDAEDDEREPIRRALAETGGNISRAAERLGITRHGLKKRMARLGMRAPSGSQGKAE
ncbi:sigma 54-interacting transcriptional regulator [Sorangium sp. So ce1000]|uniref:sigma 54-interacting transcriptional regulator n=1 Tax=Sorangium sp. So ce1000 TaxID=3133325 RepID=UPI003F648CD9